MYKFWAMVVVKGEKQQKLEVCNACLPQKFADPRDARVILGSNTGPETSFLFDRRIALDMQQIMDGRCP